MVYGFHVGVGKRLLGFACCPASEWMECVSRTVASDTCQIWNFLYVTRLAPRVLKLLVDKKKKIFSYLLWWIYFDKMYRIRLEFRVTLMCARPMSHSTHILVRTTNSKFCTVIVPLGVNPTAVNKYIISHHIISYIISYHIISYQITSHHISYRISDHITSHHIISYHK